MTGADAQHGFFYQNYVGVYRAIESFLSEKKPEYIRFESQKENLEDINIFYNQLVVYEQVKIQQHTLWIPSRLKEVLSSFAKKYSELSQIRSKYIFRFTTNTYYNKDIRDFVDLVESIKNNIFNSNDDLSLLDKYFEHSTDNSIRIEILRNMQLEWNFFAFENHIEPQKRIKEGCMRLLSIFSEYSQDEKLKIIHSLFDYICKCSSVPGEFTDFTLSDFNSITNLNIIDEYQRKMIINLVGIDIFVFLESLKPKIISYRDVHENDAITYIYFQGLQDKAIIGIIDDFKNENEIEELCDYIKKNNEGEPYLLLKGDRINKIHIPIDFREKVYSVKEFKDVFKPK